MIEKIVSILQASGVVVWGLSILVGAFLGYDGSIFLGLLMGFTAGAILAYLFNMIGNIIKKPYLLLSFLFIPIGYLIGLFFWGDNGGFFGKIGGGVFALLLLIKLNDE